MARAARRSGRRTDYTWFNFGDQETAHDITTSTSIFGSTAFVFSETATITRLRGQVGVVLNTFAVNESVMVLCGLMTTSTDSVSAGLAPEIFTSTADEALWIW